MAAPTDWFRNARWGVFTHYLTTDDMSAQAWNAQIDAFDVEALARQLEYVGAPYYVLTIGQNSGHFCAPNATYDRYVGQIPSKCSQRDLVADIAEALERRGIKLMVYLPSGAPSRDSVAIDRLGWEWGFEGGWPTWKTARTGHRLVDFQLKWEEIISEWSLRWGDHVYGWWFDGCYFADEMYRSPEPPNFQSLAAATKAGNASSLVAFNPGVLVPVICHTPYEDYTAGEISEAFPTCPGRCVDQAQYHILSYLGERWGGGEPRFPDEFVIGYTKHVNSKEGVVSWDVPINAAGQIPAAFIQQLSALQRALR